MMIGNACAQDSSSIGTLPKQAISKTGNEVTGVETNVDNLANNISSDSKPALNERTKKDDMTQPNEEIDEQEDRQPASINFRLPFTLFTAALLICAIFLLLVRKEIIKLKKQIRNIKDTLKSVKKEPCSKEKVQLSSIPIVPALSKEEIEALIDEKIRMMQKEIVAPEAVVLKTNDSNNPQTEIKQKEIYSVDTTDVKYNQSDNSFSLEKSDVPIWRIYSQNDDLYYTIVDDESIREGMATSIETFKGCITYQSSDQIAQRIEPVTDGKLIRCGDKLLVDENNKLEVRFV